jgi:hypothetical protein
MFFFMFFLSPTLSIASYIAKTGEGMECFLFYVYPLPNPLDCFLHRKDRRRNGMFFFMFFLSPTLSKGEGEGMECFFCFFIVTVFRL